MVKSVLLLGAMILALSGVSSAANPWRSDYDQLWNINVYDRCTGVERVYSRARIVNNEQSWVVFMPDQGRISSGRGRIVRIPRIDPCLSIAMVAVE
jgi:hypothetical protein